MVSLSDDKQADIIDTFNTTSKITTVSVSYSNSQSHNVVADWILKYMRTKEGNAYLCVKYIECSILGFVVSNITYTKPASAVRRTFRTVSVPQIDLTLPA